MLPSIHRLHRQGDIRRTLREGRMLRSPFFVIRVLNRADDNPSRLAVVVGKRVHLLAVRRHRYQRWLREAARALITEAPIGYDMVVVAQPSLSRLDSLLKVQKEVESFIELLRKPHDSHPS